MSNISKYLTATRILDDYFSFPRLSIELSEPDKESSCDDITVDHIIYNDPATIVFWKDGTKTVVKKSPKEPYNKYTAFCAALAKKVYGNNSQVNKIVEAGIEQKPCDKKKKSKDKSQTKFVRDEKGRWCSAPKTKKEKKK